MGTREHAEFVQRPSAMRPGGRIPGAARFQQLAKRTAAVAEEFDLLTRFGQVHGQRNLVLDGDVHGPGKQFGMNRVGCVRTQAGLPRSRFTDVPPGRFQRGFDAIDPRGNQFQENRAIAGRCEIGIDGPARLGNLADRGDAVLKTLLQTLLDGRHPSCRRVGPLPDHVAEPLDEPHARAADRAGQIAEFQVRMGVDQSRHDGHLAQVFGRHVARAGCRRQQSGLGRWSPRRRAGAARPRERPSGPAGFAGNRYRVTGIREEPFPVSCR